MFRLRKGPVLFTGSSRAGPREHRAPSPLTPPPPSPAIYRGNENVSAAVISTSPSSGRDELSDTLQQRVLGSKPRYGATKLMLYGPGGIRGSSRTPGTLHDVTTRASSYAEIEEEGVTPESRELEAGKSVHSKDSIPELGKPNPCHWQKRPPGPFSRQAVPQPGSRDRTDGAGTIGASLGTAAVMSPREGRVPLARPDVSLRSPGNVFIVARRAGFETRPLRRPTLPPAAGGAPDRSSDFCLCD
ncbi:hypothetical protein AAFF_G00167370 [Aldrovandia affinis]|uniref:Uncharacterized protein n=1 Tax=Aldrovandia affinis TaxID=143900 RepID=A0AAD7W816_9TELE|nr:hypothetical protein AAFF_G00167370 [Aldrovandia affinis]